MYWFELTLICVCVVFLSMVVFRFSNQADITRLLLSKGANVNLLNNSMCTALHIAVNKGFTDVVRVLTEHSADVNLQVRGPSIPHTSRIQSAGTISLCFFYSGEALIAVQRTLGWADRN